MIISDIFGMGRFVLVGVFYWEYLPVIDRDTFVNHR